MLRSGHGLSANELYLSKIGHRKAGERIRTVAMHRFDVVYI